MLNITLLYEYKNWNLFKMNRWNLIVHKIVWGNRIILLEKMRLHLVICVSKIIIFIKSTKTGWKFKKDMLIFNQNNNKHYRHLISKFEIGMGKCIRSTLLVTKKIFLISNEIPMHSVKILESSKNFTKEGLSLAILKIIEILHHILLRILMYCW